MTAKILCACTLLMAGSVVAAGQTPQRSQIEVKLTSLSRSERGDTLTAAITLTNKSPYYVFLLLVDKPHAVNDAGEVFDTSPSVNGVAWCKGWDSYPCGLTAKGACVTNRADSRGMWVPPSNYTEIDPDASAVFTIVIGGPRRDKNIERNKDEKITLTQELGLRYVKDVEADQKLPDKDKIEGVIFKSMHFNAKLQEVVTSSITFGPVK